MKYRHLLFDLDHTLWDHHRNANETLQDLYHDHQLGNLGEFSAMGFQQAFHKINHGLWEDYRLGRIDQNFIREYRFPKILETLGVARSGIPSTLAQEYLDQCPSKTNLMPYALEVLDYLKVGYHMTIITNGFFEVQATKMTKSGLSGYFDQVITSEEAGYLKPHHQIFDFAVDQLQVAREDCVMIGDNPNTDIAGARGAGIDQIYYDPHNLQLANEPTHRVQCLKELIGLL